LEQNILLALELFFGRVIEQLPIADCRLPILKWVPGRKPRELAPRTFAALRGAKFSALIIAFLLFNF
jgi:hypothetical protein